MIYVGGMALALGSAASRFVEHKMERKLLGIWYGPKVHQADLLFLPHNRPPRGKKVYKYALTVFDVASRFKAAEPFT
ncbi:hypothetical protein pdam_00013020 [Pocillopora damicornis]|uniref:Uncharacterized protein n=1 Tax=Pocillopora damicornis TaxID=46731 RepID=A0A3M6U5A3_POCDA|nr:hypothetical protein pdam_00013020 [Pocillopora damicornis]